ncbi:MAG: InlB B-repeat-containing protein [Acholeplasmataceae bacterium]
MFKKTLSVLKYLFAVLFITAFLLGCKNSKKEVTYQVTIDRQGVEVNFSKDIEDKLIKGTNLTFQITHIPIGKTIHRISIGSMDLVEVDGIYSFTVNRDSHIKIHLVDVDDTRVVFYDVMGGSNHLENPTSYVINSGLISLKPASKPGYTFDGWYYENKLIETIDTSLEKDLNIMAKFIPINYTITYELNGGINHPDNPSAYSVEGINKPLLNPTKIGYKFLGWFLDEMQVSILPLDILSDVVLTAKYEEVIYALTIHTDDEKEDDSTIDPNPEDPTDPTNPQTRINIGLIVLASLSILVFVGIIIRMVFRFRK